jgi:molybdate transport system substrate-binding protein
MIRTYGLNVGCAALLAYTGFAPAAEIKVFSTIGVQSALEELAPQFEKASGHKLNISWATAAILVKRVQAGESADLMVLTKQSLDALTKDNKASARPENLRQFRHGYGHQEGGAKARHFDAGRLQANFAERKSYRLFRSSSWGCSGVYFAKLLERMGIAEQMKAKTRHPPPSGNSAVLVVNGEAELAIQQEPEVISVAGVDLVGPLPPELNNITVYAAGVGAGSQQAEAANALTNSCIRRKRRRCSRQRDSSQRTPRKEPRRLRATCLRFPVRRERRDVTPPSSPDFRSGF